MSRTPRTGATPSRTTGTIILIVAALAFIAPLYGLVAFTVRPPGAQSGFTIAHYAAIFDPTQQATYTQLFAGIRASLVICVITAAIILLILLPTMLLTELRYPRVRRVIEFICLMPLSVPTVVLVVGFIPVYQRMSHLFGSVSWPLSFFIGVISLPFAFRPIQTNLAALDLTTLGEAARSLGAGWLETIWRVVLPNLRRGILSASLLTVSVVLGEFTIAEFLQQNTFQTALFLLQQTDPYVAAIFSVAALVFVFILLVLIGSLGSFRRTRKAE